MYLNVRVVQRFGAWGGGIHIVKDSFKNAVVVSMKMHKSSEKSIIMIWFLLPHRVWSKRHNDSFLKHKKAYVNWKSYGQEP